MRITKIDNRIIESRMKGFARAVCFSVVAGIMTFGLTSCGKDTASTITTESNVVAKAGTVQLYHATETGVEPDADRYQLMQPDNLAAALEEIIEKMTLSDKMTIDKYLVDESRNVTLFITVKEGITEEELLLNRAAIVRNVGGLDTGEVAMVMSNENGDEIETATYTDASFYYYTD